MMRRRSVGRSVARVAVGSAVMAGTAGAVQHHQQQKWANEQAAVQQQQQMAYEQGVTDAQQQQPAPPPPAAAAPAQDDLTAKLQNLANLHAQGVLTDEEFAAAKKKLLEG
ncbi:MAG TPA: SHOCT domain-containing protein [Anaerolineales bacterium]|nr:SHOCT domain-containing protein [Anaerolineales bacterium]